MDNTYQREAWQRLGNLLQERRGQLGYGFRERNRFLRDRGGERPPSLKTIGRLERGERGSYPEDTIAKFERLYGWEPGSVRAVLDGGAPAPRATAPERPPSVTVAPGAVVTPLGPAVLLDPGGDEEQIARSIMDLPAPGGGLVPWETRRGMIRSLLDLGDRRRTGTG